MTFPIWWEKSSIQMFQTTNQLHMIIHQNDNLCEFSEHGANGAVGKLLKDQYDTCWKAIILGAHPCRPHSPRSCKNIPKGVVEKNPQAIDAPEGVSSTGCGRWRLKNLGKAIELPWTMTFPCSDRSLCYGNHPVSKGTPVSKATPNPLCGLFALKKTFCTSQNASWMDEPAPK
jgi:hypothetical protein